MSVTEIDGEIASVVSIIHQAAAATIPPSGKKSQVKNFVRDEELKQKCQASKSAWRIWRNANRPRTGPLYEQMKTTKSEVKSFVRKLRAKQERMTLQACSGPRMRDVSIYTGKGWSAKSSWWMERLSQMMMDF